MQIEYKIKMFCKLLVSLGWEHKETTHKGEKITKLSNHNIYEDSVDILIYKKYKLHDYSEQLLLTIKKACQLDERIITKKQTDELIRFLKTYQLQFSKSKKEWIIPEPNSKYNENEIPSIYIP